MFKTHGMHGTKMYECWHHMKQRCLGTSNPEANKNYHERGITFSEEWNNFEAFYRDMGSGYFDGAHLDRIDNNSGYGVDNCRWTTAKVNANNRRSCVSIEHDGVVRTLSGWCEFLGANKPRIYKRWTHYGVRDFDALFSDVNLSHKRRLSVEPCSECGTTGGTIRPDGLPRRSRDGLCNTCYHRKLMKNKRILDAAGYLGIYADMQEVTK